MNIIMDRAVPVSLRLEQRRETWSTAGVIGRPANGEPDSTGYGIRDSGSAATAPGDESSIPIGRIHPPG